MQEILLKVRELRSLIEINCTDCFDIGTIAVDPGTDGEYESLCECRI